MPGPCSRSAALLGAGLCLLAARYLGADAVGSLLGARGQRWRSWVTAHGFSAVLASRLAPGVPAGMVNYLGGLAGIAPRAFLAAVALGALPKTIAYVTLGGALDDPLSTRGALAVALYVAPRPAARSSRARSSAQRDATERRSSAGGVGRGHQVSSTSSSRSSSSVSISSLKLTSSGTCT